EGDYYRVEEAVLEPKPIRRPRPTLYAGGESPKGKETIAALCDGWLTHGDPPGIIGPKVRSMQQRRAELGLAPLTTGVAGYVVVRDTEEEAHAEVARITDVRASSAAFENYKDWVGNTELERRVSLEDYSVSNRGLRAGLVGTPDQVAARIREFQEAGVDLLLLQFSPQMEEMERFAELVIPKVEASAMAL
ncbi:MAG: LLM class flavin-dependent oxidoreductase, partial [Longimicrobiales bacterium]|nr:LLM class flavin-dependent oxidoreductase [Longimicrobiales bacterium]